MTSSEIREKYLTFFKERGHVIVPSAPIVIKNDPTLMFTNAGMNQFKDFFLGNRQPNHHRIADTQKCLRVSGKHNDLEEVGVDTYHHTMFEMLGNWSIGDPLKPSAGYFKKEAISWSFELLHQVYGIPIERMFATVSIIGSNICQNLKFFLAVRKITFGRWETPGHVGHVLRSTWTAAPSKNRRSFLAKTLLIVITPK